MLLRRVVLVVLSFTLATVALGCTAEVAEKEEEKETTGTAGPIAPPATKFDFEVLEGAWSVTTTLVSIDNPTMTPAADQPGAQWATTVDGEVMTLVTDLHEYAGTLTSSGASEWSYEAVALYEDEDGATWTSTITVRATQDGDNAFTATMEGTIDSDADGHLYTATWNVIATRM